MLLDWEQRQIAKGFCQSKKFFIIISAASAIAMCKV
jgi:hypothetical protein